MKPTTEEMRERLRALTVGVSSKDLLAQCMGLTAAELATALVATIEIAQALEKAVPFGRRS